jgi:serine/threonine protein kinase
MYTSNDGKPMIKNYLVRETLGKGSFGTVVKAISQPDQKVVAIKIMDTSKM